MPVSYENSKVIFEGIKAAGIKSVSALPETWLGLLLQRAEDDPEIDLSDRTLGLSDGGGLLVEFPQLALPAYSDRILTTSTGRSFDIPCFSPRGFRPIENE